MPVRTESTDTEMLQNMNNHVSIAPAHIVHVVTTGLLLILHVAKIGSDPRLERWIYACESYLPVHVGRPGRGWATKEQCLTSFARYGPAVSEENHCPLLTKAPTK